MSSPNQPVTISAGTLFGHGTVEADVLNAGTVRPATTGGVLTVTGSYTQTHSGSLATTIAGTTAGNGFGQLKVAGIAKLAGALHVATGGRFNPPHGHRFPALVYQSRNGAFTTLAGGPRYTVVFHPTIADVIFV